MLRAEHMDKFKYRDFSFENWWTWSVVLQKMSVIVKQELILQGEALWLLGCIPVNLTLVWVPLGYRNGKCLMLKHSR